MIINIVKSDTNSNDQFETLFHVKGNFEISQRIGQDKLQFEVGTNNIKNIKYMNFELISSDETLIFSEGAEIGIWIKNNSPKLHQNYTCIISGEI